MIRLNAILLGSTLVIVLKYIGSTSGAIGADFGIMIAGGIIGYLIDGNIMNCIIHGVLIGIVGASILGFIDIINVPIYGLRTPVLLTISTPIVSSAIFGAAGAVLFQYMKKLAHICK